MTRRVRRREGFVLVAVLIIVSSTILIATGVAFLVRGEVAGSSNAAESTRMRAAAWSAVQAAAARLGAQRSEILAGATPSLEPNFVLWEAPREVANATLLPLGPAGETLVPEGAKLDLGQATSEELAATKALDDELIRRLLARRDAVGRPLDIDALLGGAGDDAVTMADLHGPLEELSLGIDEDARVRSGDALRDLLAGGAQPRGAADLLTAFAYDAPLDASGEPRVALSGEWTDDRRGSLDALLGSGSARLLEDSIKDGKGDEAAILAAWRSKHPDPKEWAIVLDRLAWSNEWVVGKVDVMRASAAALKALPGVTDEIAGQIVRERDAVPAEERRTAAWLATRGIIPPGTFVDLAPRLSTRTLFWRVRVAVRFDEEGSREGPDEEGDELGRTMVMEAVIDVSGNEPRIALLRDVSALDTVVQMVLAVPPPEAPSSDSATSSDRPETEPPPPPPEPESIEPPPPPSAPEPAPAAQPSTAPSVPHVPGVGRWRSAG